MVRLPDNFKLPKINCRENYHLSLCRPIRSCLVIKSAGIGKAPVFVKSYGNESIMYDRGEFCVVVKGEYPGGIEQEPRDTSSLLPRPRVKIWSYIDIPSLLI